MFCRLPLILAALAVCSSCSKPGLIYVEDDQSDMPRSIDFAGSTADLAGTMTMDMASARDLASGYSCRGEDAPGKTYKLVMNSLTLPGSTGSSTFAYDFDGDGRTENQLKNLVAAVSVAGLDLQTPLSDAVSSGQIINLISLTSDSVDAAACVGVSLNQGKGAAFPKFDGSDVFTPVSPTGSPLSGALASGKLTTTHSRVLTAVTESQFELQISLGKGLLKLPLRGAQIEGIVQSGGPVFRMTSGVLHGVVAKKDIDDKLLPAIADQITDLIHSDPTSSNTRVIINLFESSTDPVSVTKCMTPSRCCRLSPATCVILPEEVQRSPIGGVLSPDVEVLDDLGKWKPVPGGKKYNAMSVGLGFSAITASY